MHNKRALRLFKFSFATYKVLLAAIIVFAYFGVPALNIVGVDDEGFDIYSGTFFISGTVLIVLGVILQFVHMSLRLRHIFSYIATFLIFLTVVYDAFGLYVSFTTDDYSLVSAFLLVFTFFAAVSFYAVFTKKIRPLRFAP